MNKLLKRYREYGTTDRQSGSGRPKTARTAEKIEAVDDLILSQDGAPQTHRTTCQIARETGIHRSSVTRNVHKDPVDFKIRGVMQKGVCRTPIRDVAELKQHLIDTWSGLQQSVIDERID